MRKWGRRALAFARRTKPSHRSFAVVSGPRSAIPSLQQLKPLGGVAVAAAMLIIIGTAIFSGSLISGF